jgi:hypothetical protein
MMANTLAVLSGAMISPASACRPKSLLPLNSTSPF